MTRILQKRMTRLAIWCVATPMPLGTFGPPLPFIVKSNMQSVASVHFCDGTSDRVSRKFLGEQTVRKDVAFMSLRFADFAFHRRLSKMDQDFCPVGSDSESQ